MNICDFGALGYVDGIHFYRLPLGAHTPEGPFAVLDLSAPLPRVDILYSYAGCRRRPCRRRRSAGR